MSIMSAIRSTAVTGLVKATGIVGVGAALYDSHVMAKMQSSQYTQQQEANRVTDSFQSTMYQEQPSAITSGIKKKIFNFQMENNLMMPIYSVVGYLKGFASMLVTNVIPMTLGALALFGRGKTIPRTSALGLALYGGYQILREGFGVGQPNRLNQPFKD